MALKTMYKGKINSPDTALVENIGPTNTVIKVTDISVFPDGPNLATIGTDEEAETILYGTKTTDSLTGCTRGFQGVAKAWESNTIIARNMTEYDLQAVQDNITELNTNKAEKTSLENYLPLAGGTVTGNIFMDGQSVNYIRPETSGGWARGFFWRDRDSARTGLGSIGMLGSGSSASLFYFGFGTSPWSQYVFSLSPTVAEFKVPVKINGKNVLTEDDKLSIPQYCVPFKSTSGTGVPNTYKKVTYLSPLEDCIALRNSTGQLIANDATADNHLATYKQVKERVAKEDGKGLSTHDLTTERKNKVDAIPANPKYTDTTYGVATQTTNGLQSAQDKKKLDGLYKEQLISRTAYDALTTKDPNTKYYIYEG